MNLLTENTNKTEEWRSRAARFSELDVRTRALWAKSCGPVGHGLLAHMLDVAAVAEVLLEHEPPSTLIYFAAQFSLPESSFVRYAAALVGLHDFGKAIPGFQAKWPQGRERCEASGLGFTEPSLHITDHACASAALLWEHLPEVNAKPGWVRGVLQAISAHHGYNFQLREINAAKPAFEAPGWSMARKALFDSYWQTLKPEGVPLVEESLLAAVEWLAGLTSAADWIGSNPDWFSLEERADSLIEHFEQGNVLAAQALEEIGWTHYRVLLQEKTTTDCLIARIVNHEARPLQSEGDRLLADVRGPALLLVEVPMGEGKTELAFLAYLRLQAATRHRSLYVALPTQATGNALFDRARTFLKAFYERQPLDIQLVHGGAQVNERVQCLRGIYGEGDESVSLAA